MVDFRDEKKSDSGKILDCHLEDTGSDNRPGYSSIFKFFYFSSMELLFDKLNTLIRLYNFSMLI